MTAFWLNPDWSGGDNLRDGASPFWMKAPKVKTGVCEDHGQWIQHPKGCPSCLIAKGAYYNADRKQWVL